MILALAACLTPFPPRPVPVDSGAAPVCTPGDGDEVAVGAVAAATYAASWSPAGAIDADGDDADELVVVRSWQGELDPPAVAIVEPAGAGFATVVPERAIPGGACLDSLYSRLTSASPGLDVTGDGRQDLAVGVSGAADGGLVALYRADDPDGLAATDPPQATICFGGQGNFGTDLLLVPDAGDGPALVASLRGGYGPAGLALYDASDLSAGAALDAESDARAFVRLDEVADGGSWGGAIGAADVDGDGVWSAAAGTVGLDGYDPQRVFVFASGMRGGATLGQVNPLVEHRINGSTVADEENYEETAAIASGDLDGDGVDEWVLGFGVDGRVAVARAADVDGRYDVPAAELPGATGPRGFGDAVEVAGDLVWVGSLGDDDRVYAFDAACLAEGVSSGVDARRIVGDASYAGFGASLAAGAYDEAPGSDLAAAGWGASADTAYLLPGALFTAR